MFLVCYLGVQSTKIRWSSTLTARCVYGHDQTKKIHSRTVKKTVYRWRHMPSRVTRTCLLYLPINVTYSCKRTNFRHSCIRKQPTHLTPLKRPFRIILQNETPYFNGTSAHWVRSRHGVRSVFDTTPLRNMLLIRRSPLPPYS
jgi:hypothetical protein